MSGAAGGVTINKEDLKATIRDYRETVLKPLNLDKSYNITGIRRRPEKNVFGDIDVVISFPGGDKKDLKQEFARHLEQIDKIPTIPHKKNLKYFIHGSIVTTLFPIVGKENQYVQIDNIVASSKDEGKFTYSMLDLPAQEQGLALGLAKTVFTELNDNQINQLFKDLNIPQDIETPGEGEEYDFNLNTSELSLRIVPIGQNGGREIWKSTNFNDIKTLLKSLGIDIEKDKFEDMIQIIKQFKNRRSIDRLKGMFTRNIRVGDAEVGRDKGIAKQKSIDIVSSLEEKYTPLVMSLITPLILEIEDKPSIAVFPGKFKPPHKDHLARIQAASDAVGPLGTVKVFISPLPSKFDPDQETITSDQSLAIFNLYQDKGLLPNNVEFEISPDLSPVVSAYKEFEKNINKSPEDQQPYIAVFGKKEKKRFDGVSKIPNVTINDFPEANVGDESATNIRISLKNGKDISEFLPKGISSEEYKQALNLPPSLNEIKYAEPSKFDYPKQLKSLTEFMLDKGMNIRPLPKVKFVEDDVENARNFFGKTAYYNPNQRVIVLYTMDRHPKDIMRSFAHEMIHHMQNCEDRLNGIFTQDTNKGGNLPKIEKEAYLKGNWAFRTWTDTLTKGIEGDRIECDKCNHSWPIVTGGKDLYVCHECGHDNTPKSLNEETKEDDGTLLYESIFEPDINILVAFGNYENYKILKPLFNKYGYGFYSPEDKTIILNGERFINSNLDFNDLKFVEAHEITHLLLGHTGPYSEEDEMDADLGAYILLKNKKLSTDRLVNEFENRHGVPFTEELLERVKNRL
jgi:Zn-dependent peptidase ImmA (M78 family)